MATSDELKAKIAKLDAKLESGASDVTVNGVRTTLNIKGMQAERARLIRKLRAVNQADQNRLARPISGLGNF